MKQKDKKAIINNKLRNRAEKHLQQQLGIKTPKLSPDETERILHELYVHQIELEMQNEELMNSQLKLEETRSKYYELYNEAPVGYFTIDNEGRILESNLTAAKQLFTDRKSLLNVQFYKYVAKENRDIFYLHLNEVFKRNKCNSCEIRLLRKDNIEFYAQLNSVPLLNQDGKILCRTTITDITDLNNMRNALEKVSGQMEITIEEKTAELKSTVEILHKEAAALKKTENELHKFKFFSDKASDGYLLVDRKARLHCVNVSACRMLGYPEKELLNLDIADIDVLYDETKYIEMFDLIQYKTIPPVETKYKRKDGSVFFSEIALSGYEIDGGTYMLLVLRDITNRKSIEEVMLNISKGISCKVGDKFFQSLAEYLNNILSADYAYIAEMIPGKPNFVRTLSFIADGKNIDNIDVNLSGTPCESALANNICSCPSGVQSLFPHARIMAEMNIEGYVGKLLYSSSGQKLGLIAVMYRRPVENVVVVESTLRIFAARASAEIERRQAEDVLFRSNNELEMRVRERTLELGKANKYLKEQIDKLKLAKNALRESEKRFRVAATCTTDLIWEGDIRSDSLHWFGDIDGMLGYEVGEFPRTISGHMASIHPEDVDNLNKAVQRALESGKKFYAEYRIQCRDGTYRYWYESGKPLEFEDLKAVKWVGSVTNITERKLAEEVLRQNEARHRTILQTAMDGLWLLDLQGRLLEVNESYCRMSGYSKQELLTMSVSELEVFESADAVAAHCQRIVAQGEDRFESRHRRKDGSVFDVEVSVKCLPGSGQLVGFLRDITERKQAEDMLRESEESFRALYEDNPTMYFTVDEQGLVLSANPYGIEQLGYKVQELIGYPVLNVFHSDDKEAVQKQFAGCIQNPGKVAHWEFRKVRKDGSILWVREAARAILSGNNKLTVYVVCQDITESKQAEFSLIESEGRYKNLSQEFNALLDAIPDNLILLSPELKILWANKAFASHVGKKASGITGQHCYNLCCRINTPCKNCPVIVSFKSGKEETTRVMNTQGRIFNKRAFPIKDKSGEIRNVIEVTRDITAKVHMEEEAKLVQSRLIHTNKMTSIGTLVSGVAHEINNPNSFILNNTQVFAEIWEDAVKILADNYRHDKNIHLAGIPFTEIIKVAPKLLYGINDGALRIKHIVDNLRNFARPDKARMDGRVDVNTVIMMSTSILESQINKFTNNYQVKCEDDLPLVKGSAQQIEQVVINLIMNALQALPDKEAGVSVYTKLNKRANRIEIKVADEGCGIDRKILDRVTEPFFTTRFDIGGTGLGLSISDTIIREHNGSLIFKSKEGKGTTVTLKLPLYNTD